MIYEETNMTIEQILEDIKTDRAKKCILDSDMANEMDDQYALAYCLGSDKIDLLSVNAAPFTYYGSFAQGVQRSYDETVRILDVCRKNNGSIPVFKGCERQLVAENDFSPVDCPAVRNIIDTVKNSDEIIYVLTTGCCSNITSAILTEPCIKDNMCVIWLGANCLDYKNEYEYNLLQDFNAGQILINSGVPLVLLPALSYDNTCGTQVLDVNFEMLSALNKDSDIQKFFREDFPMTFVEGEKTPENLENWHRVIWDLAAPGVIAMPNAYTFKIMVAPIITDDKLYAFDQTRHKIIYMEKLDKDAVLSDTWKAINSL